MKSVHRTLKILAGGNKDILRTIIAVFLIAPIFFSLESGLFRSSEFMFESAGIVSKLPIPLSVLACYLGIALMGNYRRADIGIAVLFGTFVLMAISTVATTSIAQSFERGKMYLLVQYLLPIFALALGMIYEDHEHNRRRFEKTTLVVLALLVPFQLVATWAQGTVFLTPYLYIFSVYQHLQYVPTIFASVYVLSLFALWNERGWNWMLVALAPALGVYATASGSMSALAVGALGTVALIVRNLWVERNARAVSLALSIAILFISFAAAFNTYVSSGTKTETSSLNGSEWGMYSQKMSPAGVANVVQRLTIWRHYGAMVTKNPTSFFLGQGQPPERTHLTSAHNYYLDFIYNFGFFASLPIVVLIGLTLRLVFTERRKVIESSGLFGLVMIVGMLLLAENSVKVGMRIPYPGIFTFFLWGLLLSRLDLFRLKRVLEINVAGKAFA